MFDRRELLIGGMALAALPSAARAALPVPPGDKLAFDVMRNGSKIGTQILTFERTPDGLIVRVAADMVVKVAFITFYKYSLRVTEKWAGDQVVSLTSTTNDNGTKYSVNARRDASGLVVEGSATPRYVAPANALPATHWNRRELDGPWINPQDGKLMRPAVARQGVETIPTVAGGPVKANRFVLTGDVQFDMWYDSVPSWAGLTAKGKDGSLIRYVRHT